MASNERDDRDRWGRRRPADDDDQRRFRGEDDRGHGWRGGADRDLRGRGPGEVERSWDRVDHDVRRFRDEGRGMMGRDEDRGDPGRGWDRGPGDARNVERGDRGWDRDRHERGGWGREGAREGGWSPGQSGAAPGRGSASGERGSSSAARLESWARGWGGDVARVPEFALAGEPSREGGRMAGRGDEPHERGGMRGRGPLNYARSDQRIYEDVCDILTDDDRVDAAELEVKVDHGEVTLIGSIGDRDMKRRAEDLVDRVPGVKDVHNQIKVRAPSRDASPRDPDKAGSNGALDRDRKGDKPSNAPS